MTKNFTVVLSAILLTVAFMSCQKGIDEPTATNASDITGKWKFISLQAQLTTTQEVSDGGDVLKTITLSDYTSENNTGSVTIDETKMTSNNLSYSINTISKSSIFENGTLIDTLSVPFQVTIPASSGSANYQRISADSIYGQAGTMFIGGAVQSTQAGGMRIKMENDKLYLMESVMQTTTTSDQGAIANQIVQGKVVATLQRQ